MNDNKLFNYILIGLLGLSAVLCVLFFAGVITEGLIITWCYILLGVAAITAVVFPILQMAQNPADAKNALIGVVALATIFTVGYLMAGDEIYVNKSGETYADALTSKMSEAGLIAFYILGAIAIGTIIYTEVSKSFK